jgi:acylglycerol lipase
MQPPIGADVSLQVSDKARLGGLAWEVGSNRPNVVIAHGINEHIGRYEHLASALNQAGFNVCGYDHQGHGRSARDGKRTSNMRRFDVFVDDYLAVLDSVHNETGRKPIALGHSMGGLIAARAALRTQDQLSALVLSGPALKIDTDLSGFQLKVAMLASRGLSFLKAPGGIPGELSRDPAVRDAFAQDPLCINDPIRIGIAGQLFMAAERTRAQASQITLPLLVMHGERDPITNPDGSREFVANAKSPDKTFIAWPEDFHEIFNELDRDAVIAALTAWLTERFRR